MDINPKSTALVFPGQGSQRLGMGSALAKAESQAADLFAQADELLGFSLSQICWHGPGHALDDTANTQPALLTHSIAVLRAFRTRLPDFEPACTAGHSMGEFSALVAAGSLSFPDALGLVRARGQAMKAAGEAQPGGMLAVLGLDLDTVEAACEAVSSETGLTVGVANDNCPGQVVVSGQEAALETTLERLSHAGARKVVRLAVSIASHSSMMEPAQVRFGQSLKDVPLLDPRIPLYGNVEARPLHTSEAVVAELNAQLTSRVRWTESVSAMIAAGTNTFLELGPGNTLSGLIRRIDSTVRCLALDAPDSFEKLSA
ncbi:MAG: ACP S-malonyltransferase [Anaerolineales bacterium]|jgi:[acyl-carrier-protein] S-malonyltransferase